MNSVVLSGRIATDLELKYTPKGTALLTLRLAVKDPFKKNSEGKPTAYFFDVKIWDKPAEFVANYLKKGDSLILSGELKQETWTAADGTNKSKVVVEARNVEQAGSSKPKEEGAPAPAAPKAARPAPPPVEEPDYDPFADDEV